MAPAPCLSLATPYPLPNSPTLLLVTTPRTLFIGLLGALLYLFLPTCVRAQQVGVEDLRNTRVDGYRGIWFALGKSYLYGDKYAGGLATYTAKHRPLAVYAPAVNKTYFVYGGTPAANQHRLLCMIGVYDHTTGRVERPTVVYDKGTVDDPHDNPVLSIDGNGYLWVFVSGRGTRRPGIKLRSRRPYSIAAFDIIAEEEFTYPQVWPTGGGFFHFFTKYSGFRNLYYERSTDGNTWTDDAALAQIKEAGQERSGHYQVSAVDTLSGRLGTFFNRHPNGVVDRRTDLYYVQTDNEGTSWTTAAGEVLATPLRKRTSPARVIDYAALGKNVYLKDMAYTAAGHPVCLYLTSNGPEPGPQNAPYEWQLTQWTGSNWQTRSLGLADHNYDTGSLWLAGDSTWYAALPGGSPPQPYGVGGEIMVYSSSDAGATWSGPVNLTRASRYNHGYVRTAVDARAPFQLFWCDGHPQFSTASHLYFGTVHGEVFRLPYRMMEETEAVERW